LELNPKAIGYSFKPERHSRWKNCSRA